MNKKILAIFVACALMIPMLTSCGRSLSTSSTTQNPNTNYAASTTQAGAYAEATAAGAPVASSEFNTEEYNQIVENSYMSVSSSPLSTFSADVDTASYSNVRRMINDGSQIPADAVRIEEMINYFSYDYPEPEGDDLFTVTRELADCPWNSESKLLMIGVQAKNINYDELPASNFVFLLDVSGSMYDSDKLPLVVAAMKLLTENLREEDRISIVVYAGDDAVLLDGASG